jgi:hypothetical protein
MNSEQTEVNPYAAPAELDPASVVQEPVPDKGGVAPAPFPWRYASLLMLASMVASVVVLPYTAELLLQSKSVGVIEAMMPIILIVSVVIEAIFSLIAIVLGLGLGRSLGLVWPPLEGWDAGAGRRQRMRSALVLATGLGIISAGIIEGLGFTVSRLMPSGAEITLPSWWACLLGSVGAGVREEIWLRLGTMTFFVWIAAKLARQPAPGAPIVWTGNLVAAFLFGAIHLPQAAVLFPLNAALVAYVFLGNGIPALLFGWLYWRKGLVAAMVSHTVADIVTKVLFPLLGL